MLRIFLAVVTASGLTCSLFADEPSVTVTSPVDSAVIFQRTLHISGTSDQASRIAILVQGLTQGSGWKVASFVNPRADGSYRSTVTFSDVRYDIGYRILAVASRGARSMRSMRLGMTVRQPPSSLLHSKIVRITLAGSARPGSRRDSLGDQILMPVDGSVVGPLETVVIEGKGDPLPVVLIRPDQKGGQWYVQQEVKRVGQGRTAVEVRFGGKLAVQGDRFEVCLAIPQSPKQRAEMHKAKSFAKIPASIPHGAPTAVKLSLKKLPSVDFAKLLFQSSVDSGGDSIQLLEPGNGSRVSRRALISGRFDPKMHPVVLVQTELDKGTWYVQPPCQTSGASFSNQVYLGKLGTPAGTRFQVVAMMVAPQDAINWKPGGAVTDLPSDVPISKPILVVHNGSDD